MNTTKIDTAAERNRNEEELRAFDIARVNGNPILVDFTDHEGVRSLHTIEPRDLRFTHTNDYTEPQWMLVAFDLETRTERDFPLRDIHRYSTKGAFGRAARASAAPAPVVPAEPLSIPEVHQAIRDAGGIVHSDGNIFFTRAEQFIAAAVLCREEFDARHAAAELVSDALGGWTVEAQSLAQRVNDLHEGCEMPRDQARELAMSEAGITPDNQWFGDMMILQVLADSDHVNEQEREVLTRWMAASRPPALDSSRRGAHD